jgi:hypothetical protein
MHQFECFIPLALASIHTMPSLISTPCTPCQLSHNREVARCRPLLQALHLKKLISHSFEKYSTYFKPPTSLVVELSLFLLPGETPLHNQSPFFACIFLPLVLPYIFQSRILHSSFLIGPFNINWLVTLRQRRKFLSFVLLDCIHLFLQSGLPLLIFHALLECDIIFIRQKTHQM